MTPTFTLSWRRKQIWEEADYGLEWRTLANSMNILMTFLMKLLDFNIYGLIFILDYNIWTVFHLRTIYIMDCIYILDCFTLWM